MRMWALGNDDSADHTKRWRALSPNKHTHTDTHTHVLHLPKLSTNYIYCARASRIKSANCFCVLAGIGEPDGLMYVVVFENARRWEILC